MTVILCNIGAGCRHASIWMKSLPTEQRILQLPADCQKLRNVEYRMLGKLQLEHIHTQMDHIQTEHML